MLRIAPVGIGWAGTRHVEAIRKLGRKLTVDCLVDNDADHLKAKAKEVGIEKTYTDLHDALADPDVDAVSICAPYNLHCTLALEAAAAKKHVLCEKPIALTVDDATRMIDAVETHDVKLYVAEHLPYTPMSKFLRELVRTGKYIGEPTFASMVTGFQAKPYYGYPGQRSWLSTSEQGGTGTWMLHGIHSMAQLRFIFGDVETIYMRERKASSFQRRDVEDTMNGLLTMESGIHVSVTQTCETRPPGKLGGYILYGDEGSVHASQDGCEVFPSTRDRDQQPLFISYPEEALSDYAQEMEAFVDYITGVSIGPATALPERRSLAIVQGGYESAQAGQPVNLKDRFGEL